MRDTHLEKRPMEDNENIGSSGSSKRQRRDNHSSRGFGSGPAGRHHLLFTDTTQEAHNQAITSRCENFGQAAEIRGITSTNLITAYKEVLDEYPDTLKISNFSKECKRLLIKCREGRIDDIRRTLQEWENLTEDRRNISNKRKRKLAKILLNKAHDQAGPSRQGDTTPIRAEQISQLIDTLIAKSKKSNQSPDSWRHWTEDNIRRAFRESKMNQTEYKHASEVLGSRRLDKKTETNIRDALRRTYREISKRSSVTGSEAQGQERSPSRSSRQNPIGSFRPSKRPLGSSTALTWETSHQTQKTRDLGPLGEILATSSQGRTQQSPFESPASQSQPTGPIQETSHQGESHGLLEDVVSGSRRTEQTQGTGTSSRNLSSSSHRSLGQTSEQRTIPLGPELRGPDQAGSSRQGNSHRDQQERTWTTQQLNQLVDEIVQIKHFDHSTFQNALTEESKAILNELNSKYRSDRKSVTNQEMNDIETRFKSYNVLYLDPRRRYLRTKSAHVRSLQNRRNLTTTIKAVQEGFRNTSHRYHSRQKSSKDA